MSAPHSPARSSSPTRASSRKITTRQSSDSIQSDPDHTLLEEAQQRIASLELRSLEAESELRIATALLSSREGIHSDELRKVEVEASNVQVLRRQAAAKLASVDQVEDAVRDLYSSMKDRIGFGGSPSHEQTGREKEDSIKDMPILVVLGHLHALCKGLYLFKQEAEADLRGVRARATSRDENTLLSLKHEINDLKLQVRHLNLETESAHARAEASEEARVRLLTESQAQVQKMSAQHQELLSYLRDEIETSKKLRGALEEACEEGRKRDAYVMTNRQLESKRYFDRASQDKSLRSLEVSHQRQMRLKDIELREVSDLRAKVAHLEEEVGTLKAKEKAIARIKSRQPDAPTSVTGTFSPTQPLASTRTSRASSFAGRIPSSIFSSRPASAVNLGGSRRFAAEGSAIKASEALMETLRDSFQSEASAVRKEKKEAGLEELLRDYSVTDVSPHHKAARSAIKAMRATLNEGANGDLNGLPLATSVFLSRYTKTKKASVLVGDETPVKAVVTSWGSQAPTGLESERSRAVTWQVHRPGSSAEELQHIKNKIDAGLSPTATRQ